MNITELTKLLESLISDPPATGTALVFRSPSTGALYMCSIYPAGQSWSTSDGTNVTYLEVDQVPGDLCFHSYA